MCDATHWIDRLGLEPHPEGGYYAETYAADAIVDEAHLSDRYDGDRPTATSIYYLLEADDFSAFHRLASDELWHFYRGDPLTLSVLGDGLETVELGRDRFQAVVPGDTWFAAETTADGDDEHGYALVGCDVTPGFHYDDFELAGPELADEYPAYRDLIERLTR